MLLLLTGSHCPHVKVHVPDTELNSSYTGNWNSRSFFWVIPYARTLRGNQFSFKKWGRNSEKKERKFEEILWQLSQEATPHTQPWTAELNSSTMPCQEQTCPCFSQEVSWSDRFTVLRRKEYILVQYSGIILSHEITISNAWAELSLQGCSWWDGKGGNAEVKAWSISYQQRSDKLEIMNQLPSPKALLQVWSGANNLESEVSWQAGTKPDYNSAPSGSSTDRGAL